MDKAHLDLQPNPRWSRNAIGTDDFAADDAIVDHSIFRRKALQVPIILRVYGPAFARLILWEVAYEATICTAILNAMSHGRNRLFLTLLGGGAFGNETA